MQFFCVRKFRSDQVGLVLQSESRSPKSVVRPNQPCAKIGPSLKSSSAQMWFYDITDNADGDVDNMSIYDMFALLGL